MSNIIEEGTVSYQELICSEIIDDAIEKIFECKLEPQHIILISSSLLSMAFDLCPRTHKDKYYKELLFEVERSVELWRDNRHD